MNSGAASSPTYVFRLLGLYFVVPLLTLSVKHHHIMHNYCVLAFYLPVEMREHYLMQMNLQRRQLATW